MTIIVTVYGSPAPQGSKRPYRNQYTGKIHLVEQSEKVKPWRQDVKTAAIDAMKALGSPEPLDGPLAASMVFTVREQPASRPVWWPKSEKWSKSMLWRPASAPDISKLLRSTEDALTGVVWKDDARVAEYVRLAKYYVGYPAEDVFPHTTGAVIRVWSLKEVFSSGKDATSE